jgi:hypothetical protein
MLRLINGGSVCTTRKYTSRAPLPLPIFPTYPRTTGQETCARHSGSVHDAFLRPPSHSHFAPPARPSLPIVLNSSPPLSGCTPPLPIFPAYPTPHRSSATSGVQAAHAGRAELAPLPWHPTRKSAPRSPDTYIPPVSRPCPLFPPSFHSLRVPPHFASNLSCLPAHSALRASKRVRNRDGREHHALHGADNARAPCVLAPSLILRPAVLILLAPSTTAFTLLLRGQNL